MKQPSVEAIRERYGFLDDGAGQVHDAIHKIDWVLTGQMMEGTTTYRKTVSKRTVLVTP